MATKRTYYYNGQKIRTSGNEYKYALLYICKDGTFKTKKCSATYKGCETELNRITRAETIANETGLTIEQVWESGKYHLWSDQLEQRKNYIIAELEAR